MYVNSVKVCDIYVEVCVNYVIACEQCVNSANVYANCLKVCVNCSIACEQCVNYAKVYLNSVKVCDIYVELCHSLLTMRELCQSVSEQCQSV